MRRTILCFLLALLSPLPAAATGTVEHHVRTFASLQNSGGENPERSISVYLPTGYATSDEPLPVVYFLPGFGSTDRELMQQLQPILDAEMDSGRVQPMIVVVPDHTTLYRGSYFANSSLTGNWIDYTARDVVDFVQERYRTLDARESRALVGWSSGAYGALKIGMLHPEVFAHVYSMSPGILTFTEDFGPQGSGFTRAPQIESREHLVDGWDELYANLVVAMGRAFSPNPDHPPFYADLPFVPGDQGMETNEGVLRLWERNAPLHMLDEYEDNLRELDSLGLEWGRNDDFPNVIDGCRKFSAELERRGIEHRAQEYLGTHFDRIFEPDGRVATQLLPFLDRRLERAGSSGT